MRSDIIRKEYGTAAPLVEAMILELGSLGQPANPICQDFYENTRAPRQAALDYLIRRGIKPLALTQDGDGLGSTIGEAYVTVERGTFNFAEPESVEAQRALIVTARDRAGHPLDMVAWEPKVDRVSSYLDRATVIGEHELDAPRYRPISVRSGFLDWLRHDRTGIVIVNERNVWRLLHDEEIEASTVEHGLALRKMLRPPAPKIVISERTMQAAV